MEAAGRRLAARFPGGFPVRMVAGMRSRPRWTVHAVGRAAIALMVALMGVCAGQARATNLDMSRLPVITPNLCLACHTSSAPTPGTAALNVFGLDFQANGRVWDSNLAALDSDGDGCLNGVEVGDSDGDGSADGNVTAQAGNPGVQDECGSGPLVDEIVWGRLKAMFDGN
jgi:hypothetical protein